MWMLFLRCFMKFDERNQNLFKIPPFLFPWQLQQSLSYRFRFFLGLSRSTRCGCDRKHYYKHLWSLVWIKNNAPWLPWQRPPFWLFSTPKSCHTLRGFSYKVSWSLMKGIQFFFQIPIFCFHGNCDSLSNRFQLFGIISFYRLCMFFLLSFINFCSFIRCFIKFDEKNKKI